MPTISSLSLLSKYLLVSKQIKALFTYIYLAPPYDVSIYLSKSITSPFTYLRYQYTTLPVIALGLLSLKRFKII